MVVTHLILIKLHPNQANSSRRHWLNQTAHTCFCSFPLCEYTWKVPIEDDLKKWDGLIWLSAPTQEQMKMILESPQYLNWVEEISPYVGCLKGWTFQ